MLMENGGKKIKRISLYECGYCINNMKFILKGHKKEKIKFPALSVLIEHNKFGNILFDTGYSKLIYENGIISKIYNLCNKTYFKEEDLILNQIGDKHIDKIIISHSHPDHIGALKYFKDYIQINPEEILEYALNADWKVLCSENTEYTIEDIEEFIKHSYSNKAQEVILNSRVIKKLKRIAEYKNKFINESINVNYLKNLRNSLNSEQYDKLFKHFVDTNASLTKLINNDKQLRKFIRWYTCNSKKANASYRLNRIINPRTSKYIMDSTNQKEIFNYI